MEGIEKQEAPKINTLKEIKTRLFDVISAVPIFEDEMTLIYESDDNLDKPGLWSTPIFKAFEMGKIDIKREETGKKGFTHRYTITLIE